jgi:PAS domain S-box-containing protein
MKTNQSQQMEAGPASGRQAPQVYAVQAGEAVADAIWVVDVATMRFLYANPASEKLRGFSVEESLAQTVEQALTEESWKRLKQILPKRIEQFRAGEQDSFSEEFEVRTKTGEVIWTESVIRLRENPKMRRLEAFGVTRDITPRVRLEAHFRQAQKMEAVGQLAGGLAHDFNNIMAATIMHLELLLHSPGIDEETGKGLKELMSQARRAAGLTRQLLLFSRRSVMQRQPTNLNEVVENLLKMLHRLIGEDIRLEWNGQTSLPQVLADAGMLEQVIVNLAVNARDAMPRGGSLAIAAEARAVSADEARAHPDAEPGRYVCLSVRDTGCGMDEATLKRVFEPFFTTKEAGKGTGLGLATVYGIVTQHRGWVTVKSSPGKGTVFSIYLPALSESAAPAASAARTEPPRGGEETILLVEDEPAVRNTLTMYLGRFGYQVLQAVNGVQALEVWALHSQKIQLLLTDMVMPEGLSGLDLAEKLRASRPGLPVIVTSGYSTELVEDAGAKLGEVTFLAKPCSPTELASAVRKCLDEAPIG